MRAQAKEPKQRKRPAARKGRARLSAGRTSRQARAVGKFIRTLARGRELGGLLSDLSLVLTRHFHFCRGQFFLLDETTRSFVRQYSFPAEENGAAWDLPGNSPLVHYFRKRQPGRILESEVRSADARTEAARGELRTRRANLCLPLLFRGHLIGFLLLERRPPERRMTPREASALRWLAEEVGVALDRLLLADELELAGRISRGMAHDLKSLLTPVSTFLQLCRQGSPKPEVLEEFLPVALANLETVDAYVRQALFFSQHHTPQFSPQTVAETIAKASSFLAAQANRKKLTIRQRVDAELVAEVDEVLCLRLVSNLLSNAINASAEAGVITLALQALTGAGQRHWLRLEVMDEGKGMGPEKLQRAFQFRLPSRSSEGERGGSGLGLPICRKIVQLHGGKISLKSAPGKGTTVTVDLPTRQPA